MSEFLKDKILQIYHLDEAGNPEMKEYPLTEKQRYFLQGQDIPCGNTFLGEEKHALTIRIRSVCSPPDTTEAAINWIKKGMTSGAFMPVNPFEFIHPDSKEFWHIEGYVPKKRTWEELEEDMREMRESIKEL